MIKRPRYDHCTQEELVAELKWRKQRDGDSILTSFTGVNIFVQDIPLLVNCRSMAKKLKDGSWLPPQFYYMWISVSSSLVVKTDTFDEIGLLKVLTMTGIYPSMNEASKKVKGGGVSVNFKAENNPKRMFSEADIVCDNFIFIAYGKSGGMTIICKNPEVNKIRGMSLTTKIMEDDIIKNLEPTPIKFQKPRPMPFPITGDVRGP